MDVSIDKGQESDKEDESENLYQDVREWSQ
jgi:hypothetical protein